MSILKLKNILTDTQDKENLFIGETQKRNYKSQALGLNSVGCSQASNVSLNESQIDEPTQLKRQKLIEEWQLEPKTQKPILAPPQNTFYELPENVGYLYKKLRNIKDLYEWQKECLSLPCLLESQCGNLLYLSPTSGGKTLIAEIMMLKCLLLRKKSCIFVLPFVSIVQEKVKAMQEFAETFNFYCEEYAHVKGQIPPVKRRNKKASLYICTIEKANTLINSLIETNRLESEIGLLVADELHMIGDGPRGATYELVLSKIKFKGNTQIIATTATLENKKEVASFLNATLFERNHRPVELKEYVKFDKQIFYVDLKEDENNRFKLNRVINYPHIYTDSAAREADPDYLVGLVSECVPDNPILIFCSTKKNCENVALLLCKYLPQTLKQHKRNLKLALFNEIKSENGNQICSTLRQSIQFGIAYHHSGLTSEERQLIEQAYRDGILCVITCTSTLAAGVNLPAKRVIIRSPYVGQCFLTTSQYKQMVGRAGRAGLTADNTGESILVVNQKSLDRSKISDLMTGPMGICKSSLICDDAKAIRSLILSLIGLKLIECGQNIYDFFKYTLFYIQCESLESSGIQMNPKIYESLINALNYLLSIQLISSGNDKEITLNESFDLFCSRKFDITKLGIASVKSGIDLDLIPILYLDLKQGLKGMVLSTYLNLLYLCTPYDLLNSIIVDYDLYAKKFCNLNEDERRFSIFLGITEQVLENKRRAKNVKIDEKIFKRFYLTLILNDLWKTNNAVWQVSGEYQLDRGFVQQIVQSAASFSNGVLHFCQHLDEFWAYKCLLEEFCKRLQYNCVSVELIPLLDLDNVRLGRAKQLFMVGLSSIEVIAKTAPEEIVRQIPHMLPLNQAKKIVKSAQKILKEKAEILQNEAENLLDEIRTDDSVIS